jgi:hypothetical protein
MVNRRKDPPTPEEMERLAFQRSEMARKVAGALRLCVSRPSERDVGVSQSPSSVTFVCLKALRALRVCVSWPLEPTQSINAPRWREKWRVRCICVSHGP